MAFQDWSIVADNNDFAPGLNWAEGMSPADINNNIREMMAQLRHNFASYKVFSPEQFGAVGSPTNDTAAFIFMAQAVEDAGGGTIELTPGRTYVVGQQTFAGATGLGYAYTTLTVIEINDCTLPVVVNGNGAKLVAPSGLKYGAFNPTTGAAAADDSSIADERAYGVSFFSLFNNASVAIRDLEIDGNLPGYTLGGTHHAPGDTGTQLSAYGIQAYGNGSFLLENVNSHHHPLDSLAIGWVGMTVLTPRKPHTMINSQFEYSGRQGLSLVGGNAIVAINCSFSYTGRSTVASSPGAGVDFEAEGAVVRNAVFINCEMVHNTGVGVVADSGDSANATFIRCKILGSTYYSIWPKKPGFNFIDCQIYGQGTALYASLLPNEATHFTRCLFSFDLSESPNGQLYNSTTYLLDMGGGADGVVFQSCGFNTSGTGRFPFSSSLNVTYRDCTFKQSNVGENSMAATFEGTTRLDTGGGVLNIPANAIRGRFIYNGTESDLYPAVAAPAGGATVDAEARTAINGILTALQGLKIVG